MGQYLLKERGQYLIKEKEKENHGNLFKKIECLLKDMGLEGTWWKLAPRTKEF